MLDMTDIEEMKEIICDGIASATLSDPLSYGGYFREDVLKGIEKSKIFSKERGKYHLVFIWKGEGVLNDIPICLPFSNFVGKCYIGFNQSDEDFQHPFLRIVTQWSMRGKTNKQRYVYNHKIC